MSRSDRFLPLSSLRSFGKGNRAQPQTRPEVARKERAVRAFLSVEDLLSRDSVLEVLHRQASHYSHYYSRACDVLTDLRNVRTFEAKLKFADEDFAKRT
jgi:hypothetical protein